MNKVLALIVACVIVTTIGYALNATVIATHSL